MSLTQASSSCRRRPVARCLAGSLAVVAGASLLGACGGSSSPAVANLGGSHHHGRSHGSSTSAPGTARSSDGSPAGGVSIEMAGASRKGELRFSRCMRANGVSSFPDPNGSGVIQASGIDPRSAQFQAAQRKCMRYAPHHGSPPTPAQQAAIKKAALAFSVCMRSHGVTNFPDPQFSGGHVSLSIGGGPGSAGNSIDPSSPIFQRAQQACNSKLPALKARGR